MVQAVVGANWGDEGKGKITDMLMMFNMMMILCMFWKKDMIILIGLC